MSEVVREPTKKELLWDIRQLLHKLVYGSEAEGLKPLVKIDNEKEYKKLKKKSEYEELKKKIEDLEYRISILEIRPLQAPIIPNPSQPYYPPGTTWCQTKTLPAVLGSSNEDEVK